MSSGDVATKREDDFGATNDGIEYKPVEPESLEDESD